jgi:hypothetical protein
MSSKAKLTVQGTGRLIRIGVFSASALLPLVTTIANRVRARQAAAIAVARERNVGYKENLADLASSAQSEVQERLQTVGATLSDVLTELQTRSNNQELIKRTLDLREDLIDRSSKLSHALVERSGEVSHEFAKRGRQAQMTLAEQERSFWIALGFGFGLTATGIVTFVLVRRRLLQKTEVDEPPIQLPDDAATPKSELDTSTSESRGGIYAIPPSNGHIDVHSDNPSAHPINAATASQSAEDDHSGSTAPADAAFVGVTSTKRYYPVKTPLDQLTATSEKLVDIIYFVSEEEAQSQGFHAAEI